MLGASSTLVLVVFMGFACAASANQTYAPTTSPVGIDPLTSLFVVLGRGLEGALGVFGAVITSMIVDVSIAQNIETINPLATRRVQRAPSTHEEDLDNEDKMGKHIGLYQGVKAFGTGCGAAAGVVFLSMNLEYYGVVWSSSETAVPPQMYFIKFEDEIFHQHATLSYSFPAASVSRPSESSNIGFGTESYMVMVLDTSVLPQCIETMNAMVATVE
tara:strand:+ start:343 stop:990 length:648 start_codon:yes stop_codon:yes gene_type:complete